MRSVVCCYAPEDADEVREIGGYLEANCEVEISYDEGRIRTGADLVDAVEVGLSADVALVFFSPASWPGRLDRERWEPVFRDNPGELGGHVVFVLLRDCQFPKVLLRRPGFFDLSSGGPARRRDLKRWFFSLERRHRGVQTVVVLPELPRGAEPPSGVLDELERRLSDEPGSVCDIAPEDALAFAHMAQDEFDGVFWIDCAHRGPAGIIGDAAHALGLRLTGTLEENQAALTSFVTKRRCLLVFSGLPREHWNMAGSRSRCSVIFTPEPRWVTPRGDAETAALFSGWARHPDECLAALGNAERLLGSLLDRGSEGWPEALRLGSAMAALLRSFDRLAEAHDVLETLTDAASDNGDPLTVHRLAWEQGWIREQWGQPAPVRLLPSSGEPAQLALFGES